ncbi:acyl-CoA synthetase [Tomitella biformata]|uniref:acyl-CoA synthetase n=1 Tax=Tomitella biformata TaxID=630403 RepID=UPI00046503FE|nr:acyl-CoA synthetase [Tomitella biformata]
MAINIADFVEHSIDLNPDRVALLDSDRAVTFGQLEERANRLAHYLRDRGVKPGDKVGIYSRNTIEAIEAMVAIFKARAVMVNVNYRYVENELKYIFENSDMAALIVERRYVDRVAHVAPKTPQLQTIVVVEDGTTENDVDACSAADCVAVEYEKAMSAGSPERDFEERSPDDIFMLYTGGTTGMPKGVMWRHEDWWRVLGGGVNFVTGEIVEDEWELAKVGAANPAMVRFPIPPMIHGGSQSAVFHSLFGGGTLVMHPEFDGHEVWQVIDKHKINLIFITGDAMARPMIDALLEGNPATGEPYDLSSLYVIASSAALFSPALKEQFLELLPNRMLTDSIGSSETGFGGLSLITKGFEHSGGPRVKIDAATVVIDDAGVPVVPGSGQVGLLARHGHIPLGYYKDEAKTAETFKTLGGVRYSIPGDYATVEEDGTVIMLGRGSVSINSGGEKIYPEEVEGAIKSHPDVFDALVVGVPDERWGQRVAAVIAVRPGSAPSLNAIVNAARKDIAGYKVPRSVWFVDAIARNPAGKPNYKWANEQVASREADDHYTNGNA